MPRIYKKKCPKCYKKETKKDGKRKGKQSYKCNVCNHVWTQKGRSNKNVSNAQLYKEYAIHKQTYKELGERYGISSRTVKRRLDSYVPEERVYEAREVILLIDTTYFGDWGVMAFKCKEGKQILHHEIVGYETNEGYRRGVRCLEQQGWKIVVIVCDGRRGLLGGFGDTPTQMCHFHQHQIMRRYITKNPKLQANKDLKKIVSWLSRTSRECLEAELERWYKKHEGFLKEQGVNSKGKKYYKHQRTRSGYYSLKRNMKYLFVYLDYLGEIDIPNTTNGIEAVFSHLKPKVGLHRGLKKRRKIKLIKYLLTHK